MEKTEIKCEFCHKIFDNIDGLKHHMLIYKRYPGHQKDKKDFKIQSLEFQNQKMKEQIRELTYRVDILEKLNIMTEIPL